MSRVLGALGLAAVVALATAIAALLVAVLAVGTDRAVLGALIVALSAGALALPIAWWILGRRAPAATASTAGLTRR